MDRGMFVLTFGVGYPISLQSREVGENAKSLGAKL
jgi:hypothetical protein